MAAVGRTGQLRRLYAVRGVAVRADDVQLVGHGFSIGGRGSKATGDAMRRLQDLK
jgi:hypothetical protein